MDVFGLNLRHLRAVVEVSRHGSVSGAATAVNLTQPAITQALIRLERGMGQPLFVRRADGMTPTPAAELFVPRAEAALAHVASNRVTMAQLRARSEEHTSELQSLMRISYAVLCLKNK